MGVLQYVSASALSMTLGGNTGVAPFLTLLLVGVIEKANPNLLYMEGWTQKVVSSWPSIAIFGALTIVEFVAHCVPCIDAIYDSAMVFIVPILSICGSFSAFGLFSITENPQRELYYIANNDNNMTDNILYKYDEYEDIMMGDGQRMLASEKSGGLIFLQVILCLIGITIAIFVHLFKLLMRVLGEGCCTCCITCVELSWTVTTVIITIFIVPIAIGTAIILICAAAVGFKRKVWDKRMKKRKEEEEVEEHAVAAAEEEDRQQKDQANDGETKKKEGNDDKKEVVGKKVVDEETGNIAIISNERNSKHPATNPEYIEVGISNEES